MCVCICIGMYLIGTFFFSCWFCWSSNAISSDLDMCHDLPQHNTRNTNYNSVSTLLTQLVSKGLFNSSLDRSLLSRIGACSVSQLPHWDVSESADDQFRGKKRADLKSPLISVYTLAAACWCPFDPWRASLSNGVKIGTGGAMQQISANARLHFVKLLQPTTRSSQAISSSLIWGSGPRFDQNLLGDCDNAGFEATLHPGDLLCCPWAGATVDRHGVLTKHK